MRLERLREIESGIGRSASLNEIRAMAAILIRSMLRHGAQMNERLRNEGRNVPKVTA